MLRTRHPFSLRPSQTTAPTSSRRAVGVAGPRWALPTNPQRVAQVKRPAIGADTVVVQRPGIQRECRRREINHQEMAIVDEPLKAAPEVRIDVRVSVQNGLNAAASNLVWR